MAKQQKQPYCAIKTYEKHFATLSRTPNLHILFPNKVSNCCLKFKKCFESAIYM